MLTTAEKFRQAIRQVEYSDALPWRFREIIARRFLDDPYKRNTNKNPKREFIFIHVPKAAGTSLANAIGVMPGHIPVSRYRAWNPTSYDAACKIAFVRNPWTRLASAYNYLRAIAGLWKTIDSRWADENLSRYDSFEEFVLAMRDANTRKSVMTYMHFLPQTLWITLPGSSHHAMDFLGRFENLKEDVKKLADLLEMNIPLKHERKPLKQLEKVTWSGQMIDIVADMYQRDFSVLRDQDFAPPN